MERLSQEEVRQKIMKSVKDGMFQWNLTIALISIHYLYNIKCCMLALCLVAKMCNFMTFAQSSTA